MTSEALEGPRTGIANYVINLCQGLLNLNDVQELLFLQRFGTVSAKQLIAPASSQAEASSPSYADTAISLARTYATRSRLIVSTYVAITQKSQERILRRRGSGYVLHSPNYIVPRHIGPTVVTIPDLSTVLYPAHHPQARVQLVNGQIESAIASASHIITISEKVAIELQDHFNLSRERITVTHLGANPQFSPNKVAQDGLEVDGQRLRENEYFLYLGTIEPRKNLDRLLQAYTRYCDAAGSGAYPLVVIGHSGWLSESTHAAMARLNQINGKVIYMGYIPETDIHALLATARALLYPSLYEGFGLPVLEAMQSGTAVLTSRDSAMAEVGGSSVLLVDPESVDDIAEGILNLGTDSDLVESYAKQGLARCQDFSWARCATETVRAYQQALSTFT